MRSGGPSDPSTAPDGLPAPTKPDFSVNSAGHFFDPTGELGIGNECLLSSGNGSGLATDAVEVGSEVAVGDGTVGEGEGATGEVKEAAGDDVGVVRVAAGVAAGRTIVTVGRGDAGAVTVSTADTEHPTSTTVPERIATQADSAITACLTTLWTTRLNVSIRLS